MEENCKMSSGATEIPFWTGGLQPVRSDSVEPNEVFDCVVVGAGFAGLNAAIELGLRGMKVLVVDARTIGEGASSKAVGSLANTLKARLHDLGQLYGRETAEAAYREAVHARVFTEGMIGSHSIDCDLQRSERLVGAHSRKAFERLKRELPAMQRELPATRLLSREELRSFVQSPAYTGGMLIPDAATLNPAKYQFGLASIAQTIGVRILQQARMIDATVSGAVLSVQVDGIGAVKASHLFLATNAESGTFSENRILRDLSQSLVAVPAFGVVSKPLSREQRDGIIKGADIFGDTRKILNYFALLPSGERLIYSARSGFLEGTTRDKARRIVADFEDLFPGIKGVGVDYFWSGRFAITSDLIPHTGSVGNIHWAVGCCGTGITMASYLGHKVARRILRASDARTVFELPLPKMPAWRRHPRLFGAAIRAYRTYDKHIN